MMHRRADDQFLSLHFNLLTIFLSHHLHTVIADGSYRGLDQNIHHAEGFTNYTTFSLWDTYRALHPLFIHHPAGTNWLT